MLASRLLPDHLTFPFLLKSCSLHHAHVTGRALHSHIFRLGFVADVYINNSLVFMYSACGQVELARRVFEEMPERDVISENSMLGGYLKCGDLDDALVFFRGMEMRNVRTWNSIIAGFVRGGRCGEALDLFNEMRGGFVKPDKITVASVVSACASLGALDMGKWVHGYLRRERLEFDLVIGTSLIDMYGKCGSIERAFEVFREMPKRDVQAWTVMISVLAIHGRGEEAFVLLEEMEKTGMRPNNVTFGALLSACAHSGTVDKGRWCFDVMRRVYSIEPQLQHYACMVDLLGRAGLFEEAEMLIASMPMKPDVFVWGALLGACRMHGNVELGEKIAGCLISMDPLNHAYFIILSDIYANAKRFEDVKRIRDFMEDQGIMKTSPGHSLIEIDGQVYEFSRRSVKEELMKEIEWVLIGINVELMWTGYVPDDDMELFLTA
ncbi:pentatricopeptide repeat-containing protein At5g66520-like [Asparagus officinalis]|uniref:pentatricopeptide repeat-containing protein At5g66520-like n=1 Tax=Asparagus officinalis TaxID=4686 RepID=UPI00098E5074|nr:pentatricopeptide repeat-containing protein At5g66520-like [Asparagus officinalis]